MTNETKHTPTPWVENDGYIFDANETLVGKTYSDFHAAHIVKCVNMHDELVEALDAIQNLTIGKIALDSKVSACARLNMAIDLASEALKKAGAL